MKTPIRVLLPGLLLALPPVSALVAAPGPGEAPSGAFALWNGRDLSGWYGRGTEDPTLLWLMPASALQDYQNATMENLRAHWTAQNDGLQGLGTEPHLTTREEYGDFELWAEFSADTGAKAGISLRGCPASLPESRGDDAPSATSWHALHLQLIGELLTIQLDGSDRVVESRLENPFDPARVRPAPAHGPIQLQALGGTVRWRHLFLRPIRPEEANHFLSLRASEGFTELFNGKDLTGWQGTTTGYEVKDGTFVCKPGHRGALLTTEEYGNFVLRCEFKLPPGANSGLALRAPNYGDPSREGLEIQILDQRHPKYSGKLQPTEHNGSIVGLVAAQTGYLRAPSEWNFEEVIVDGQRIEVILNGTRILQTDLSKINLLQTRKIPKGLTKRKGFIGIAGHNDPVAFRRFEVKRLANRGP